MGGDEDAVYARFGSGDSASGDATDDVTHRVTSDALAHVGAEHVWVPTDSLAEDPAGAFARLAGLLVAPGSPYRSMDNCCNC